MLKKLLCWLLIFQHFNVYVLHASTGDISIIFARDESHGSKFTRSRLQTSLSSSVKPSRFSLKLKRENEEGIQKEIYSGQYEFEKGCFQPRETQKDHLPKDLRIVKGRTLGLISSASHQAFSIHFCPDGRADLQGMKSQGHVALQTFGGIKISKTVGADRLSLKGSTVTNEKELAVNDLALSTLHSSGTVVNSAEGKIKIGREAHITGGRFENQGHIEGSDDSVLDLHGNDFTNKYLDQDIKKKFRVKVNWQGQFSITNVGHFLNEADIVPFGKNADHFVQGSLSIGAKSLTNKSNIVATQSLELKCLGDLVNKGKLEGRESLTFDVGQSLTNKSEMKSGGTLIGTVGENLYNEESGLISGGRTTLTVKGLTKNEGTMSFKTLSLTTGKLENVSKILIEEEGIIQEARNGEGLYNKEGAEITSKGTLKITGQTLTNEGKENAKGLIQATTLTTQVEQFENKGDIKVHENAELQGSSFTNASSGVVRIAKEGTLAIENLTNKGQIAGDTLKGTVGTFENLGRFIASTDIILTINQLLTNAKEALISTLRDIFILGQGKLQNLGLLNSARKSNIQVQQLTNTGRMQAQGTLHVRTQANPQQEERDFTNEGLITAPQLTVTCQRGVNTGKTLGKVNFEALDQSQGMLASEFVHFTVGQNFTNEGRVFGKGKVQFEGKGMVSNKNLVDSDGRFLSHLKAFENDGHILAGQSLVFDQLTQKLVNTGLVSSQGELGIAFSSPQLVSVLQEETPTREAFVLNEGEIRSHGSLTISGPEKLENKGRIIGEGKGILKGNCLHNRGSIAFTQSLGLDFTKVHQEEDALLSSQGLTLRFDNFLNQGKVEGSQFARLMGRRFENALRGDIESAHLITVGRGKKEHEREVLEDSAFDKEETLSALPLQEYFINQGMFTGSKTAWINAKHAYNKGNIGGEILTLKTHLLTNYGHIQAKEKAKLELKNTGTNHGQLKANHLDVRGHGFENTAFGTLQATKVEVNVVGLTNEGTFSSDTTDIKADVLKNKGELRATSKLSFTTQTRFENTGLVSSERTLTLTSQGEILNDKSGKIEGQDVDLAAREEFTNEGTVQSTTGSLSLDIQTGKNTGTLDGKASVDLTLADKFENRSKILSSKALHIQGDGEILNCQGGIVNGVGNLTVDLPSFTNAGSFRSDRAITFKNLRKAFVNEKSGVIASQGTLAFSETPDFVNRGEITACALASPLTGFIFKKFVNEGSFSIIDGDLFLTISEGKNSGTLHASRDLLLTMKTFFENAKGALVSSMREFVLRGEAEVHNKGQIEAKEALGIECAKLLNAGQISTLRKITVATKKKREGLTDFENTGLILGQNVSLQLHKGESKGRLNQQVNWGDLQQAHGVLFEGLQGLLASDTLTLTIGDNFTNNSHLCGARAVRFSGEGTFINQGERPNSNHVEEGDQWGKVESGKTFVSELAGFENAGSVVAPSSMTFTGLIKPFANTGAIESEEAISLTSQDKVVNGEKGLMKGGSINITAQTFTNHFTLSAERGQLTLSLTQGDNHHTLYGKDGVQLTVGEFFTNHRVENKELGLIEGSGPVVIKGLGTFKNLGFVKSKQDMDLQTDLENQGVIFAEGSLSSRTEGRTLTNESTGKIMSEGTLTLYNTRSLVNKGKIQGKDLSLTAAGEFSNEDTVYATSGDLILNLQSGKNTGTLSGKTKVDLTLARTLENKGKIVSPKDVNIHGTGELQNKAHGEVGGAESLTIDLPSLTNAGGLKSDKEVTFKNLSQSFANEGSGAITSKGSLAFPVVPNFTNKGKVTAVCLAQSSPRLTFGGFTNEGTFELTAGDLFLILQGGTNSGTIKTPHALHLTLQGRFQNAPTGKIGGETLTLVGTGETENEGNLFGNSQLLYEAGKLTNSGEVSSQQHVDVKNDFKNLKEGKISSKGTLNLLGTRTSQNAGDILGAQGLTAEFQVFENDGTLSLTGGNLALSFAEGRNAGKITTPGALILTVKGPFQNKKTGKIGGETLTLKGTGETENEGNFFGNSQLLYEAGKLTNSGKVSSKQHVDIKSDFKNLKEGKIYSKGTLKLHGKRSSENAGLLRGTQSLTAQFEGFENEGAVVSKEGDMTLTLQTGSNSGGIEALKGLQLTVGDQFVTSTSLGSHEGEVDVLGNGSLVNKGKLGAKKKLTFKNGKVQNEGELGSEYEIAVESVREGFENGEQGIVRGPTFTFTETPSLTNKGEIEIGGSLTATLKTLTNSKILKAQSAKLYVIDFTQSGDMNVDGDLLLEVGQGSQSGTVGAKVFTFVVNTSFENTGELGAVQSLLVKGAGKLTNKGLLLSKGTLSFKNKTLVNHKDAQAEGDTQFSEDTRVENEKEGTVLSNTHIQAEETTAVANQGTFTSLGTLTFKQKTFLNNGRIESKKDLSFPNCQVLENQNGGYLFSETGLVALPFLHTLTNGGSLISHKGLAFVLRSFKNTGTLQTSEALSLLLPDSATNEGKLKGVSKVTLTSEGRFTNSGELVSQGPVNVIATNVLNSQNIMGTQGVTLAASQAITHQEKALISSAQGKVTLETGQATVKGKIEGKQIEIKSTNVPLSPQESQRFVTNQLILRFSESWDFQNSSQKFPFGLVLYGPLKSPSSIHVGGDFTWTLDPTSQTTNGLSNSFDIIADGLLTLSMNGAWVNSGTVQGKKGLTLATSHLTNKGKLLGTGKTSVSCQNGLDNCGIIQLDGDCVIQVGTSLINHPGASFFQTNGSSLTTFKAGQAVKNMSGTIHVEGHLDSQSQVFSNEITAPSTTTTIKSAIVVDGEDARRRSFPVTREVASTSAQFYAGSAKIVAKLLQNLGSVISTENGFYFKGDRLRNLVRTYKETGQIVRPVVQYNSGRWCYGLFPCEKVIGVSEALLRSKGTMELNVKGDVYKTIFPKQSQPVTQGRNKTPQTRRSRHAKASIEVIKEPDFENTGDILVCKDLKAKTPTLHNVNNTPSTLARKKVPQQISVENSFESTQLQLQGRSTPDREKSTIFQSVSTLPNRVLTLTSVEDSFQDHTGPLEVSEDLYHYIQSTGQGEEDEALPLSFFSSSSSSSSGSLIPFWEPEQSDTAIFRHTLTPTALLQISPHIAFFNEGHHNTNAHIRFRHPPTLTAYLLQKSLMESIGFASLSRRIQAREILLRVLEEVGYINARRLHGLAPVSAPQDWENLTPQQQLASQQRELITRDELGQFKDPAVVYELMESHGELVFSALLNLPKSIRDMFESAHGRIIANCLNIKTSNHLLNHKGTLKGGKQVTLRGQGTFENRSGQVSANNGDVFIENDQVISVTLAERERTMVGSRDVIQDQALVSAPKGNVTVKAHQSLDLTGAQVKAKKKVRLDSDQILSVRSQQLSSRVVTVDGDTTTTTTTQKHHKSLIEGGEIETFSGKETLLQGVDMVAEGDISNTSDGTIVDLPVHDQFEQVVHTESDGGFFGSTKTSTQTNTSQTARLNVKRTKNGEIRYKAQEKLIVVAPIFESNKPAILACAKSGVHLGTTTSSQFSQTQSSSHSMVWQAQQDRGESHVVVHMPQANGGILIQAPEAEVEIRGQCKLTPSRLKGTSRRPSNLDRALAQLEKDPSTAWVKALRNNSKVTWRLIEEEHRNWNYKKQGLSTEGAALLSFAVGLATYGMGAQFVAPVLQGLTTGTGTISAMANAGFCTLASQAAVSFASNRGNVRKTLEDLASKGAVLATVSSMATGGLDFNMGDLLKFSKTGVKFFDSLQRSAFQTGTSTGFRVFTDKLDFKQALTQGLANIIGDMGGGYLSSQIGEFYHPTPVLQNGVLVLPEPQMGWLVHKLAHTTRGGLQGALSNLKNPKRGFVGGSIGSGLGVTFMEILPDSLSPRFKANTARFGSALTAFITGQDVNASALTSTTAIEYNCLPHPPPTWGIAQDRLEQANALVGYFTTPNSTVEQGRKQFLEQTSDQMDGPVVVTKDPKASFFQKMDAYAQLNLGLEQLVAGLTCPTTPLEFTIDICAFLSSLKPAKEVVQYMGSLVKQTRNLLAPTRTNVIKLQDFGRASQALNRSNVRLLEGPRAMSTRTNNLDVGIKWGRGIQEQGMPWEDFLATRLPEGSRLPNNFKTFDFYDMETQAAISAKTLNTQTPPRLTDPTKIYSSMKKNIDATARFGEYFLSRKKITSAEISFRELHIAVPFKTQQNQWEQIKKAIEYGKTKGVIVKVTEVY